MKMSDGMLIYRAGCYLWLRWQYNIITGPVTVTRQRVTPHSHPWHLAPDTLDTTVNWDRGAALCTLVTLSLPLSFGLWQSVTKPTLNKQPFAWHLASPRTHDAVMPLVNGMLNAVPLLFHVQCFPPSQLPHHLGSQWWCINISTK